MPIDRCDRSILNSFGIDRKRLSLRRFLSISASVSASVSVKKPTIAWGCRNYSAAGLLKSPASITMIYGGVCVPFSAGCNCWVSMWTWAYRVRNSDVTASSSFQYWWLSSPSPFVSRWSSTWKRTNHRKLLRFGVYFWRGKHGKYRPSSFNWPFSSWAIVNGNDFGRRQKLCNRSSLLEPWPSCAKYPSFCLLLLSCS